MANDAPAKSWRCFHCDEVFTDPAEAELHFGETQFAEPLCQETLTAADLRELQKELSTYRQEDTDLHRQLRSMEADHLTALRREEEKGYARGIAQLPAHELVEALAFLVNAHESPDAEGPRGQLPYVPEALRRARKTLSAYSPSRPDNLSTGSALSDGDEHG
jgi:hypothetical protein